MSSYENMAVCDLRQLDNVEAIRQIERLENIAVLVLPKSAEPEVQCALTAVPRESIAVTLYLDKEAKINAVNGCAVLSDSDFNSEYESAIIVNGVALIPSLSSESKGTVIANGLIILHESLKQACALTFPMTNGKKAYVDFDDYKIYPNQLELDAKMLSYLRPNTLIAVGNHLIVAEDVTVEELQKSGVILFVGNRLTCHETVGGYLKVTAEVGSEWEILPDKSAQRNG